MLPRGSSARPLFSTAPHALRFLATASLFVLLAARAFPQAYISPVSNDVVAPGASWPITMSVGVPYTNPVIWTMDVETMVPVAHPGLTYTLVTPVDQDPKEYLYWGTVTLNYMGHQFNWDSTVNGPTPRPGDLISTACHVTSLTFTSDYPLYQRDWESADHTLHGRDVPRPQVVFGGSWFPACYQMAGPIAMTYATTGQHLNHGVTVQYVVDPTLVDGTDVIWSPTYGPTSFNPGDTFTVTTPNLPGYIYRHDLRHTYFISVLFYYQPPPPGTRERRVINTYDTVTTPIYAVFADPNGTFPPYYRGDIDYGTAQHKPWYEILDNAILHATTNPVTHQTDRTVTQMGTAMAYLTRDLYVWPTSWGPGASIYDYQNPTWYARH